MAIPYPSGYVPSLAPVIAIAVRLGVGAVPTSSDYKPVFLGNKTSAGLTATATPAEVFGPDDANTKFGARSELAGMLRAWFLVAPRGRVWASAVAEGMSAAQATALLAFSGPATAPGVLRLRIDGRRLPEVAIATGDSATVTAAAAAAMLALYTDLPVTAGAATGTLTLTAAQGGPRGNQLRVVAEIAPAGSSAVGTTVALNGGTAGTLVDGRLGAGTGTPGSVADDYTAALASVFPGDYDFVVAACTDDTNRALVVAHVASASGIAEGRRRVCVFGSLEALVATVQGDAQGHNSPLAQIIYLRGAHNTGGEIAAAYAAARIYGDGLRVGIAQYTAAKQNALSLAPAVFAPEVADMLTTNEVRSLLAAGVTPLVMSPSSPGYAQVVRPVTTRTIAVSGATSFAVIDPSKVTVAFEVADRFEAFAAVAYADKNLVPNPTDPDNAPSSPYVTWPDAIREDHLAILRTMEDEGKLIDVNRLAPAVSFAISDTDNTVVVGSTPIGVIPHFHSLVESIDQVG